MSFSDLLNKNVQWDIIESIKTPEETIQEKEAKKPEEILRGNGCKIRLVTATSFGIQIDFAKKYSEDDIKDLLKDFTIKIKNKSVFIVD